MFTARMVSRQIWTPSKIRQTSDEAPTMYQFVGRKSYWRPMTVKVGQAPGMS